MPKCTNGHEVGLVMGCDQCGAPVLYSELFPGIALPMVTPYFGEMGVLSLGLPPPRVGGAWAGEIALAAGAERNASSLSLKELEGGTWLEYYKACSKDITLWLRLVGYDRCRYRFVVVDTAHPLAPALLSSPLLNLNSVVMALVPGRGATAMDKSSSFVSLQGALGRKEPLILVNRDFIDDLACFTEDEGLLTGSAALLRVMRYFLDNLKEVSDFVRKDIRLGVAFHVFSPLLAASGKVYKSVSDAFSVHREVMSSAAPDEDVVMAHLFASAGSELAGDIEKAFEEYCKRFPDLISSESKVEEGRSRYGFYDLLVLYGVKGLPLPKYLEEGYRKVATKAKDLSVEAIR
jgi:hypothetical protein